jgi:hypothetical protein
MQQDGVIQEQADPIDVTNVGGASSGEYGDADTVTVIVRRYVEVGGEVIDGHMRLTADNTRRLAASLIAVADVLDEQDRPPSG